MPEFQVKLPDGSVRQVPAGTTPAELLDTTDAVAALVDGEPWDLGRGLDRDATIVALPAASERGRAVIRHSAAHVLAQAVTDLYPGAKYAIGPPTEDGFYYDFDVPEPFAPDDLERIEARMRQIVAEGQPFRRQELSRDEALRLFADQPYKREIIEATDESEGAGPAISVYANDGFADLCRGPHVPSTAAIPAFKLLRAAGAYWRGDESRQQLQRIYGTAWESEEALANHLHRLEEADRRDHRRLGLELDLFHFPPEIGSGLPVFHPKGGLVRKLMEDYSRAEHEAAGYSFVWTPHLTKSTLLEISGHLDWYGDSMYPPMELEGARYYPKPMNCPMHILIYRSRGRSYRELPMRLFEFGTVYRYERSGVIHGLARVRGITQDDAHIFCTREQLAGELASLLEFVLRLLRTFGLTEFEAEFATRPEKFVGNVEEWDEAEAALKEVLDASGLKYVVAEGEGAFYAPKIDVHIRDARDASMAGTGPGAADPDRRPAFGVRGGGSRRPQGRWPAPGGRQLERPDAGEGSGRPAGQGSLHLGARRPRRASRGCERPTARRLGAARGAAGRLRPAPGCDGSGQGSCEPSTSIRFLRNLMRRPWVPVRVNRAGRASIICRADQTDEPRAVLRPAGHSRRAAPEESPLEPVLARLSGHAGTHRSRDRP